MTIIEAELLSTVFVVANSSVRHTCPEPRGHPAADGGSHLTAMSFLFFPAASFVHDLPLSHTEIDYHARAQLHLQQDRILVLYGASRFQLDRLQSILNAVARIILRIPKFSANIRDELASGPSSKLPGRHCPGLPPGTLCHRFLERQQSSIGKSRGPCCPKSGYNSIWAARLLCVWAGHLEFPTAGGSTNHEQC